jgi:hypothetical protein
MKTGLNPIDNSKVETNSVNYFNIHQWLKRHYGKASKCENKGCINTAATKFEWALKKGMNHERNINNYLQMCISCHRAYDMTEEHKKNISVSKKAAKKGKRVTSIDENGVSITYNGIREAAKLSGATANYIYDSLRNKKKRCEWSRSKNLKWKLE